MKFPEEKSKELSLTLWKVEGIESLNNCLFCPMVIGDQRLNGLNCFIYSLKIHITDVFSWVYIFHLVHSDPYSDLYCERKKLLVRCEMFAFLKPFSNFEPPKNCSESWSKIMINSRSILLHLGAD